MALEEESIVQTWLNGLKTLDVKTKKDVRLLLPLLRRAVCRLDP